MLKEKDIQYFDNGLNSINKLWYRINQISNGLEPVLFHGKTILELGCGHGRLSIEMAKEQTTKVVGIDLNETLISFAKENLQENFVELEKRLEFKLENICNLDSEQFDIVVSKDTFEHIIELEKVINCIYRVLKPGGKCYIGFGPLYYSHNGEHSKTLAPFKWGHALLSDRFMINYYNKKNPLNKIESIYDLGLNKLKLKDYKEIFKRSDFEVVYFKSNVSEHWIGKMQNLLSYIPFLKEYFSFNIYCVLKK